MNSVIKGGGVHHFALHPYDFDRTVAFYTDVLGFKKNISWGEGKGRAIMLDIGDGGFVEIFADNDGTMPVIWSHLALKCDDCDAAYEAAISGGAKSLYEPRHVDIQCDPPTSARFAFVAGPDGEVIEFFQTL